MKRPIAITAVAAGALTMLVTALIPRNPAATAQSADSDQPFQGPAAYAYLCQSVATEGPQEECANWRIVTREGRTWELTDADGGNPVDLSADGRLIAYERASDHRIVVRDLVNGTVRPILENVPAQAMADLTVSPTLLGNGRWLDVEFEADDGEDDENAMPAAFIAQVADGRTIWRLPRDATLLRLDIAGKRLMVEDEKSFSVTDPSGTTKTPLPRRLRVAQASGVLTPDGKGQAAQVVSRNFPAGGADIRPARLVTIDTASGKVLHDVHLSLPLRDRAGSCHSSRWLSTSEVLLRCGTGEPHHEILFRVDTRTGAHRKLGEVKPPKSGLFELVWAED
ncbi:hypothetical protein [Nonomuraea sp. NPDC049695]|uniref:hypothetical protein n=1 Tax=Nonomuraea sp. NPDC049695 TaxID=3154734 RepID=UPI00342B4F10